MKKRDLYVFRDGLELTNFSHPRVTYAVNKNKREVETAIKDMEDYIKPSKKMQEFLDAREELAKKHTDLDENGVPKTKDTPGMKVGEVLRVYDINGQKDPGSPYRKELSELEKKYEKEREAHDDKEEKYNKEFLDDKSEFVPFTIDLEVIEEHETCPQRIMDLIFWMIKEPK